MKALKEKRIGLRSLWRRGLVILSLFALVFASCGDSSSDDSGSGGGLRVVELAVKTPPANDQYLGKPVDLTGTTLRARYSDGSEAIISDLSKMEAYPRVVTGKYKDDGRFVGMAGCDVVYRSGGETRAVATKFAAGAKVWGIIRELTALNWGEDPVTGDIGAYALGLQVTGTAKMPQKTAYVDDDVFDFAGLALEADYWYYDALTDQMLKDRKELSFADISWKIIPDYDNKINADGSYGGYVYITAGEDTENVMATIYGYPAGYTGGVTVAAPLDVVYTVKDKGGIRLEGADELKDYFFWQENTKGKWLGRLGKGAKLVVSYTGGAADKTFLLGDLAEKQRIWYNSNTQNGKLGKAYTGLTWDWAPEFIDADFDIALIKYPLTVKDNPSPGITLYYRGGKLWLPVDVYTVLLSVTAEPKTPGDILFDPVARRDNDVDNGEGGPSGLASLLTVKAQYQAYNDASKQATLDDIKYIATVKNLIENAGALDGEYIPFYQFDNYGYPNYNIPPLPPGNLPPAPYGPLHDKWQAQVDKGGRGKETIVQAAVVSHGVYQAGTYADYGYNYGVDNYAKSPYPFYVFGSQDGMVTILDQNSGVKDRKPKTQKPSVTWIVR